MKLFYRISRTFVKGLVLLFYRHRVYGVEHLIPGAAILAPNHASYLDPPLVGISAPEEIAYLARKDLFDYRILAFLFRFYNTFPIEGTTHDLASFKLVYQLLKDNYKVVIFPEGERSEDGHLAALKAGIGMLAMRARCPIIPVYIHGTYEIWKRDLNFPKLRGRTAVVFGSPIDCTKFDHLPKKVAHEAISEIVYESIERLRLWYKNGAHGTPP